MISNRYIKDLKIESSKSRVRDILIIVVCILLILNALQYFNHQTTATRSVAIRDTLIARAQLDIESARTIAPQLSRTGGSNTIRWLAETKQYVYGISQINDLYSVLFGSSQTLVPQEAVSEALRAINECESRVLAGLAIDSPLNDLWQQLNLLDEVSASLR